MADPTFAQQPVKTTTIVARGLATPNYVRHQDDGSWLALPARPDQPPQQLVAVPWGKLLREDKTLGAMRGLQPGQEAVRESVDDEWTLVRQTENKRDHTRAVQHERVRDQEAAVSGHSGALAAYGLVIGLALIGFAVTEFMMSGAIPQWPQDQVPEAWWDQVLASWWQAVIGGVAMIIGGLTATATRRGSPAMLAALLTGGMFGYQLHGWNLPTWQDYVLGQTAVCMLAVIVFLHALVASFSAWRAGRLQRRFQAQRAEPQQSSGSAGDRRQTGSRSQTRTRTRSRA